MKLISLESIFWVDFPIRIWVECNNLKLKDFNILSSVKAIIKLDSSPIIHF